MCVSGGDAAGAAGAARLRRRSSRTYARSTALRASTNRRGREIGLFATQSKPWTEWRCSASSNRSPSRQRAHPSDCFARTTDLDARVGLNRSAALRSSMPIQSRWRLDARSQR